ncbi:stabilizer of axonemal microtubules 4 [Balearica regulorum gibbericeps]|uniref:stabilizer of axonemal microtubules 4 n=1 Tax=Balearica regulorum gibbericeps TaxID=100784 RepID=UPI003F5ED3F7
MAHDLPHFSPHRAVTGYVSNNHSAISRLLCPRSAVEGTPAPLPGHRHVHHRFKPLWLPDGRSLLPRHVCQPGSGYLQEGSRSCFHTRVARPQGPPKSSSEHSTGSCCTGPAQPDVLQKMTISTKKQSGFTRATSRNDSILPALPGQPLGVSVTTTAYLPSVRSHHQPGVGRVQPGGGGIQPQHPGGFSTNSHPTGLGYIIGHPPACPPPPPRGAARGRVPTVRPRPFSPIGCSRLP